MKADVLVIGGGVIGASAAYHLRQAGLKTRLLERNEPFQGSTTRATGGFRAQFSTPINVQLSLLSREKLLRFQEETGIDPCYQPNGYLFCARNESQLQILRDALRVQHQAGLTESHEVSFEEMKRLNPALFTDDLVGGTFCPTDGFMVPMNLREGYLQAAQRLGAIIEYGVGELRVVTEHGRVKGVQTVQGETIDCPRVVNAAGAWAGVLARAAGVDLPVEPLKRHVAVTQPTPNIPPLMPMTIDVEDGFHLRPYQGRARLLMPLDLSVHDPFDDSFDERWLEAILPKARRRIPILSNVDIDRAACWAGLYEMSPDKHAILGEAKELSGFYFVNGSSGHGVMHSPALGQLIAEIITQGGAKTIDTFALRPERFIEQDFNPEQGIL